jgi:hypothetical protein
VAKRRSLTGIEVLRGLREIGIGSIGWDTGDVGVGYVWIRQVC